MATERKQPETRRLPDSLGWDATGLALAFRCWPPVVAGSAEGACLAVGLKRDVKLDGGPALVGDGPLPLPVVSDTEGILFCVFGVLWGCV